MEQERGEINLALKAEMAEVEAARALLARVLEQRAREQPTRDQIEALLSDHTERSETLLRDIRAAIGEETP